MRRAVLPAVVRRTSSAVLAVGLLAASGAWAQSGKPSSPPDERTEVQWLQAMQSAAERLNYAGTIVYQRGGAVQSSRVVHFFDGNQSQERLQLLDGKRREYIRRGTEVQCLYPDTRRVRFERRPEQETFPAIGAGAPNDILQHYRLVVGGLERVAGLECRVLTLEPKDSHRYGHWLCADRATGLLLKALTLNERAEPLEQMAFADVRIGEKFDRTQLRPSWSTEGWAVERAEMQPADAEKSGWSITPPPGFRKLRSVTRKMAAGETGRAALQVVFSDGLATMSVFIEPGAGANLPHDVTHTQGPVSGFTRRVNDALVTVIGEVPPMTVRATALSVASKPAMGPQGAGATASPAPAPASSAASGPASPSGSAASGNVPQAAPDATRVR